MNKKEIKQICESAGVSTALMLGYHGREGDVERKVIFEGFSPKGEPKLRFPDSRHLLQNTMIGYDNVYSLKKFDYGNINLMACAKKC
jgi:hypothetical protein